MALAPLEVKVVWVDCLWDLGAFANYTQEKHSYGHGTKPCLKKTRP